eukprot:4798450-Amphidinium_carterae.1
MCQPACKLQAGESVAPDNPVTTLLGRGSVASLETRGHQHGSDIDTADLVFRFNDAECGGKYTQYVGAQLPMPEVSETQDQKNTRRGAV